MKKNLVSVIVKWRTSVFFVFFNSQQSALFQIKDLLKMFKMIVNKKGCSWKVIMGHVCMESISSDTCVGD